jgi:predicted alpha/beta superfamily hydrolase
MSNNLKIRVIYPLKAGRIVLRSDSDWNSDIEPTVVNPEDTVFEFDLSSNKSYLYFKPCVIDDSGTHWSVGNNYLGIMNGPTKDIYPHFFFQTSSRISDIIHFSSVILGRDWKVRIYHPSGYDENTLKRYPVLYMHDGSNLFFPDEAFMNREWQIDETMDLLDGMNVIDKVMVIGIYADDRMHDYTNPGYVDYGRFVTEELKPEVDTHLRTLPEPDNTAVMGSSLGGVVSFYLAWNWPHIFGKAACLSSTFSYRDDLMARVEGEAKKAIKLYLDSGWPGDNYEVTRSMRDLLARHGFVFGNDLLYFAFPNAEHDESFWSARSHIPFQFFFGKTPSFPN